MIRHKKDDRDQAMAQTRLKLLEAAATEFAREGFKGANVNRIAKAAGYAIGTFYNYFPSKRELMQALIEQTGQQHVDYIVQQVTQEEDPSRRLQAFFRAGFGFVEANFTPALAIFVALNGPDQDFKLRVSLAYAPLFALLNQEILAPGIEQGAFRVPDVEATTGLLMLIYLGTSSQVDPEGKHWVDPIQVADFVLRALRQGGNRQWITDRWPAP
jgi:AcrR family transcriptional regulator